MKGIFIEKKWCTVAICLCIICGCVVWTIFHEKAENAMFPMLKAVIVLDAGHGGWDPGKTGTNGVNEKELNLAVTEKLAEYLEMGGAEVILTRPSDEALGNGKRTDMAERKRIANESGADILVSIHQNAFPSAEAKGAQVFYHRDSEKGKLLAELLQESLKNRVDESNRRQAKENSSYYILKATKIPAVIVECGFLSNKGECALLNNPEYRLRIASVIAAAGMEWLVGCQ